MRRLSNWLLFTFGALIGLAVALFIAENRQDIIVEFVAWESQPLPLWFVVLIAFVVAACGNGISDNPEAAAIPDLPETDATSFSAAATCAPRWRSAWASSPSKPRFGAGSAWAGCCPRPTGPGPRSTH